LNGQILGAAKLDKKRKTVAFQIKPGTLNATSNVLNIVPDLKAGTNFTCSSAESLQPEFFVSDRSRITLDSNAQSPVTELSRMTSTGSLFAESESYIALPENTRDYQASLRILGRMAKSAGHGLTLADYSRGPNVGSDKHVLVIGPTKMARAHLSGAPKAFRDAMSGSSVSGDNLLQANFDSFASAGTNHDAISYAAAQTAPRRVSRGGIAALYGTGNGKLTGVISNAPGSSFVQSSKNLVKLNHWNALQGGVSRWTNSSVIMAQTAQSDAGIYVPIEKKTISIPELGLSGLELPEITWPEITWPEMPSLKVEVETIEVPAELVEKKVKPLKAKTVKVVPVKKAVKTDKVAEITPRLKPVFKSRLHKSSLSKPASLRGKFKFHVDTPQSRSTLENFQSSTKVKWSDTKRWFKAKTNGLKNTRTLDKAAKATDNLQNNVSPAGQSLKAILKDKFPGKGLVQLGDRRVSVYGLILIMAFGLVLLLMSLAKPSSRLGGRH